MPRDPKLRLVAGSQGSPAGNGSPPSRSRIRVPDPFEQAAVPPIEKTLQGTSVRGGAHKTLRAVSPGGADELWDASEVGVALGIPAKAVYDLGIPCLKMSRRRYRYWLSDIMKFLTDRGDLA